MKKVLFIIVLLAFLSLDEAIGQWNTSGNNIYNTNTGFVGIGNSSPTTLLYVAKSMTEPAITVRNLGGAGGATFRMWDNASGADWKFKATNVGGFKIRDNAFSLDVITIESNSAANALYIKNGGNVGVGTTTPHNSALVDMTSNTKGFLPPRMYLTEIEAIASPADGLIVFNINDGKLYVFDAYFNIWKEILYGSGTIIPPSPCGSPLIINHVAGSVAPVTKTVTYGTVTNIPGEPTKCWITSNLGADHQATAVDDATEASAGWYWQFNRMQGFKHDGTTRTPNTTWITSINESSEWLPDNDPCYILLGTGWRLPTYMEWYNVDNTGGWTNWNGPWNSALKMHAAGCLYYSDGSLGGRGSDGYVWSRSQVEEDNGWNLGFNSGSCIVYDGDYPKANGFSSRCLRD